MDSRFLLELYRKQAKMMYFYLRKNGCSHEDAEDIVQESYAKYIAYAGGVAAEKALSYIFVIAVNEFKKLLKKQGKERVLSVDEAHFLDNFAAEDDTESAAARSETGSEIAGILQQMNETHSELLLLKYEMALSYKEIALLLGMKEETVRTYLYRARKEFQRKWREQHE